MSTIAQYLKNGSISSSSLPLYGTNCPVDMGVVTQYFNSETKAFYARNAKWSNNLYEAEMQGLDYENFYAYSPVKIRVSDIISSASTGDHLQDDWKIIYVVSVNIDYIPIGAQVKFGGNIWIVANPDNINPLIGTAIVRRCNVVYNTYDYYGNILTVPFSWHVGKAIATANYPETEMLLMDGYQHAVMQYNDTSRNIKHNTRFILGNQAYAVRGLVNFIREYTDNPDSVHLMRFDLEQVEVTDNDDLKNQIADGESFSWEVSISGNDTMQAGTQQVLTVTSIRNGQGVQTTDEHPITYVWESSEPSVATVENGVISALAAGNVVITAVCEQNPNNRATFPIVIEDAVQADYVAFTGYVPSYIEQYESVTITAAYFRGGVRTDEPVMWRVSRLDNTFGYETSGNAVVIECIAPAEPIILTASCNGQSASTKIELLGW